MAPSNPAKRAPSPDAQTARPGKRRKKTPSSSGGSSTSQRPSVVRSLLGQYYPSTQTLREYMLHRLPDASRIRRRKIAALGLDAGGAVDKQAPEEVRSLRQALDGILICTRGDSESSPSLNERRQQWERLSQRAVGDDSTVTISSSDRGYQQAELVDFVIWLLFSRNNSYYAPKHLLCHGYSQKRYLNSKAQPTSIPGLYSEAPNHHVEALKSHPWPEVLALLGRAGDAVMVDMLLDSAVFVPVEAGYGNYVQLSGIPISEVPRIDKGTKSDIRSYELPKIERSPADIIFIRSRMMYARAALTSHGAVDTGFRHIHVLNRCPYISPSASGEPVSSELEAKNEQACTKVMMYMFPRQFRLHNVFDSPTDHKATVQKLQDYTMREDEISARFPPGEHVKTPKRLRGEARRLVQRLQVLHGRCSYAQLLSHYCPTPLDRNTHSKVRSRAAASSLQPITPAATSITQPSCSSRQATRKCSTKKSHPKPPPFQITSQAINTQALLDAATPTSHISAFCQAVLSKIIPDNFWGARDTRAHNKTRILEKVDRFVRLRRFENMSLHDVAQGLKLTDIPWLAHPGSAGKKCSLSETRKRTDIFLEFLYYVFDSLLMPLIRSNFYVTESSVHKYRLLFFRHNVWKHIAEPAMAVIKAGMFEEIKLPQAQVILASRKLGYSQIRLLPKERGVRPIMNLKRRQLVGRPGKKTLQASINSVLKPVHAMLKFEKTHDPSLLGASMFSIGDIYHRLKGFGARLAQSQHRPRLFFAKVDVKAAFDSIPQSAVLRLMGNVPHQSRKLYTITKHAEVKPGEGMSRAKAEKASTVGQGVKMWLTTAVDGPGNTTIPFRHRVQDDLAKSKKNTIFVSGAGAQTHHTLALLTLMAEHVDNNLVKIGKKFYRQKDGVPQGGILSSILCSYFYADLEASQLGFIVHDDGSLLLRLIDDFLLITTDEAKAARFVRTMHAGVPAYGVSVNPAKTLVNFELEVGGQAVARVPEGAGFPYCGTLINQTTLELARDRDRHANMPITDSLTVDFGRVPGRNFQRKVLKAFMIQSHVMFFDTRHNTERAVFSNIYDAFVETATKMWAHARCLPPRQQPGPRLVVDTIAKTVKVASTLLAGRSRRAKYPEYQFSIKRPQIAWLGFHAFREVLLRKQTTYAQVLAWLDERIKSMAGDERTPWLPRVPPRGV